MPYPEYENDLYEVYKAEVLGESMFNTLAKLKFNADRKLKIQRLAQLETQTKQRYLEYMSDKPEPKFPSGELFKGYFLGALMGLIPWDSLMKAMRDGTPPLIEVFERLQQNSTPEDQDFFNYVLAHEQAIHEFAVEEINGNPDSQSSIRALLPTE